MSEHSAVSSLGACRTPARQRPGKLTCRLIRAGVLQPFRSFAPTLEIGQEQSPDIHCHR